MLEAAVEGKVHGVEDKNLVVAFAIDPADMHNETAVLLGQAILVRYGLVIIAHDKFKAFGGQEKVILKLDPRFHTWKHARY